jgi:hypothetical protein
MSRLRLNAVAFISSQNYPILIRTFSKQDELKYHYIAHSSLDVIEERGQHNRSSHNRHILTQSHPLLARSKRC